MKVIYRVSVKFDRISLAAIVSDVYRESRKELFVVLKLAVNFAPRR